MKSLISLFLSLLLLVALLLAYLIVSLLPPSFGRRTGWIFLGERRLGEKRLGDEPDLAVIPVAPHTPRPRALRLHVLRAAAGLRALTLRFADGGAEVVDLDQTLPPGIPSRIIDLPRERRALRSLELRYDAGRNDAGGASPESDPEEPAKSPLVRIYGLA